MSTVRLTPAQTDRACGVLSAPPPATPSAPATSSPAWPPGPRRRTMIGGGLGSFAPGEWTDDTSQAVAIAASRPPAPTCAPPRRLDADRPGLRRLVRRRPRRRRHPDLRRAQPRRRATRPAPEMTAAARDVHERTGRSAGNGSLMRTGPVALAYLDDPEGLVEAAMARQRADPPPGPRAGRPARSGA